MQPKIFEHGQKIFGRGQKIFKLADGTGICVKADTWTKLYTRFRDSVAESCEIEFVVFRGHCFNFH